MRQLTTIRGNYLDYDEIQPFDLALFRIQLEK